MLPDRECGTCAFYYCDAVGDYGSPPYEIGCRKYDRDPKAFKAESGLPDDPAELDGFPFLDAPPCYEVEFWYTDFAENLDGSQESLDAAYERFRAYLDQGHPL